MTKVKFTNERLKKFIDDMFEIGDSYRRVVDEKEGDFFLQLPEHGHNLENKGLLKKFLSGIISKENPNYYTIAFANYWKRGVQKQLQANGMDSSDENIKKEMYKSLETLDDIYTLFCKKGQIGLNFREELKIGTLNGDYAKMFVDTFANGQQYRLDVLQKGIQKWFFANEYCIQGNNAGLMLGDVYIDEEGDVAVDSPCVAQIKFNKQLRNVEKDADKIKDNENINE